LGRDLVLPRLALQDLLSDLYVVNCFLLSLFLLLGLLLYYRLVNLNRVLGFSSLFTFHRLVLCLRLFSLLSLLCSCCLLVRSSEDLSTLLVLGIGVASLRDLVLLGLLFNALGFELGLEDSHAITIK